MDGWLDGWVAGWMGGLLDKLGIKPTQPPSWVGVGAGLGNMKLSWVWLSALCFRLGLLIMFKLILLQGE